MPLEVREDLKDKVDKLPAWARSYIGELLIRTEPSVDEIIRLRKECSRLLEANRKQCDRIEAMVEMFQCAAKGGNEVAAAVKSIVENFLISDEE